MQWLAVAFGGALGAMTRYGLTLYLPHSPGEFPWSTLIANVAGSVLIGLLYVVIVDKALLPDYWRPFLALGFLGALTTFSTFSLDGIQLWQQGSAVVSIVYLVVSVSVCLLSAVGSMWLAQKIF